MTRWKTGRIVLLLLAVTAAILTGPVIAGQRLPDAPQTLRVATRASPPFAMRSPDGEWSGLAIELMRDVAGSLGKRVELIPVQSAQEIIQAVVDGRADAGVAAIAVTAERERLIDFTHPYYDAGLAIAVATGPTSNVRGILQALTSTEFLTTVGALVVVLALMGALMWIAERRHNAHQFHDKPVKGIGSGFWWAAVTMATVGYGDKTPITPLGRTIAVIWMFAALLLTAVFTAHLTSSLTLRGISGAVTSVNDLPRARVGIVGGSASATFFDKRFIQTQSFPDVAAGLAAVADHKLDAFVHDEPLLRYQIARDHHGIIQLLPTLFETEDYAVVLPNGSPLREPMNQAILDVLESPRWQSLRDEYLLPDM